MIQQELINFFISQTSYWKTRQPSVHFYKEKATILQENIQWKRESEDSRVMFEPAFKLLIEQLISEHFKTHHQVLEIGSGVLKEGHSYLSRMFSHFAPFSWTFSDLLAIAEREKYMAQHLTDGKPWHPTELFFDRVIGCNVLDTIPYCDFPKLFRKIKSTLKPQQLFLHLADLNFFNTAFLEACGQENTILFPTDNCIEKIYKVSRTTYRKTLKKLSLSPQDMQFFDIWGKTSSHVQALILNNAFTLQKDLRTLADAASRYFNPQVIESKNLLERSICRATDGWEIIECGYRNIVVDLPSPSPLTVNTYQRGLFFLDSYFDPTVRPGFIRFKTNVHVVIVKNLKTDS